MDGEPQVYILIICSSQCFFGLLLVIVHSPSTMEGGHYYSFFLYFIHRVSTVVLYFSYTLSALDIAPHCTIVA